MRKMLHILLSELIILPVILILKQSKGHVQRCKLSHAGTEYMGDISETLSGIPCQYWNSTDSVKQILSDIVDADFPDGSAKNAKNYCRNPKQKMINPWCYIVNSEVVQEVCSVPICQYHRCKMSGPGVEYVGLNYKTISDVNCLNWSDTRIPWKNIFIGEKIFPDGGDGLNSNNCRNPNADPAGPWCVIQLTEGIETDNESTVYSKQYCDIPFCDTPIGVVVVTNDNDNSIYFNQFNRLPDNVTSLEFAVKLWHPDQWNTAKLKIALSEFPVPISGEQLRKWNVGFEMIITNRKVGIVPGKNEEPLWKYHSGLLLEYVKWLKLILEWDNKHVCLKMKDKTELLFVHQFFTNEIKQNATSMNKYLYYSIISSQVVWNFPLSINNDFCEETVTTGFCYSKKMLMKKTSSGHEIVLSVRATHFASIQMTPGALIDYPLVKVSFTVEINELAVIIQTSKDANEKILFKQMIEYSVSYWVWSNYKLTVEGCSFFIKYFGKEGTFNLVKLSQKEFKLLRWFAVGTYNTVAHWTFFCSAEAQYPIPEPLPPECFRRNEVYNGTEWISNSGLPCVPWVGIPDYFIYGEFSKIEAMNYCRQMEPGEKDVYCYAVDATLDFKISIASCDLRKCRFERCRKSGNGMDFMGELQTTISNKTCQNWSIDVPNKIPNNFRMNPLYPENSFVNASNFCRNPSLSIAGPWCYTIDKRSPVDLCSVPDCEKPLQCTIIIKENSKLEQKFIVLPDQKIFGVYFWMKKWNPWNFNHEVIAITLKSRNSSNFFTFYIGGINDSVRLVHFSTEGESVILKERILPNTVRYGSYKGFKLKLFNDGISLTREVSTKPFFLWTPLNVFHYQLLNNWSFDYISFSSTNVIGINFSCKACQIEVTNAANVVSFYPASIWSKKFQTNKIMLHFLSNEPEINASILFYTLLESKLYADSSNIKINFIQNNSNTYIYFIRGSQEKLKTKIDYSLVNSFSWSNISISWTDYVIKLSVNGNDVFMYDISNTLDEPLFLIYYFSISVKVGELIWTSNCIPPEIYRGELGKVNGGWAGWSSWDCSVSCGGGLGIRTRSCTNPKPSVFGQFCSGSATSSGLCNSFPCGSLSPGTLSVILKELKHQSYNVEVLIGHTFTVACSSQLLTIIKKESPESFLFWQKNDKSLKTEKQLKFIVPEKEVINIQSASLTDSGLYLCIVQSQNKQMKSIIKITAVTVKDYKYTKHAIVSKYITFKCQSILLSYIYGNLDLIWMHNDKIWKTYSAAALSEVDKENIGPLNETYSGIWECVVEQKALNLSWKTKWIFLEVTNTPPIITNLVEYINMNLIIKHIKSFLKLLIPVIMFIAFFIIIFVIVLLVYSFTCMEDTVKKYQNVKYKRMEVKKKKTEI